MTDLRTAAQQALEALESCSGVPHWPALQPTITALKAALAQQEQEPVAWRSQNATPPGGFVIFQQYPQALADLGKKIEPLYTHPPRREWVGLTEEEVENCWDSRGYSGVIPLGFARAIEQACKEKNQ